MSPQDQLDSPPVGPRSLPPLSRTSNGEVQPLSVNQAQLWLFSQLNPGSSVYNIPAALRITGSLDVELLNQALSEIVGRHDSLRTVFPSINGKPVQQVGNEIPSHLPVQDLRHEAPDKISNRVATEGREPFNLIRGPLFRPVLWVLSGHEWILQMTVHHIVADGWSMGVIARELATLYDAKTRGSRRRLPGIRLRYVDFAAWQAELSAGGHLAGHVEFWKRELSNAPLLIDLPFDRTHPPLPSYKGSFVRVSPAQSTRHGLIALSRSENTSLFATLITAFKVLLSRLSGQTDSVIGFLSANRRPETSSIVGYFVNLLPLRTDLSGNPSFREALRDTRAAMTRAIKHEDIPFSTIVNALHLAQHLSHNPVVQVVAVQASAPTEPILAGDVVLKYFLADEEKSKFDLTLFLSENDDGFELWLEYSSDLFDPPTIGRLGQNLETLLDSIAASPDTTVSVLPLLREKDVDHLLVEFNDTCKVYPEAGTLVELFERQVEKSPDAVAVSDTLNETARSLTYCQLKRQSDQLSHHLRRLGARAGSRIGVYAERSLELIVGLLGTVKSGAAYVPLDPDYPPERTRYMAEDAKVSILLTQARLKLLFAPSNVPVICLDEEWDFEAPVPDSNRGEGPGADEPAYVIYTSGSTGIPKGVVNLHRGIVNRLLWMQDRFRIDSSDRMLQKTPIGFDVSVLELLWPLLTGAQLEMARPGGHRDSNYLVDTIVNKGITTIHFVPSMLRLFLEADHLHRCNCVLKRVLCSGEALPFELQQRFFERMKASLHNFYGPTEAAIDVTWWDCERNSGSTVVPIGRPIANTQIYILDRWLQPVPIGVPGEIYIGGVNLALGYWNRPDLTANSFLANPFAKDPNQRMFKTGDLARYSADGSIEFLGRIDRQVKIRGHRVEPGEIEGTLRHHPAIGDVVVRSKEEALVAYLVAIQSPPSVTELRQFLKARIPEYMVPAKFVFLDRLPLTASAKIDYAALPDPTTERGHLDAEFSEPDSAVAKTLAQIWSSVLKVSRVGVHDNFFDLGGDSLRHLEVLYLAKEKGLCLSLQDLLNNPTIHELSQVVSIPRDAQRTVDHPTSFSLVHAEDKSRLPVDVEDAYPLSMLQAGLIYHSKVSPQYAVYVTSYHLLARLDVRLLKVAVADVVSRHPILRTSFDFTTFSRPYQLVHKQSSVSIAFADWSDLTSEQQEQELTRFMTEERARAFHWEVAPLLRLFVHKRTDESFQVTLVEPVLDGWSVALLASEIFVAYRAALNGIGQAAEPPESTIRDYIALEQEALCSQECREFWNQKLRDCEKSLLPRWPIRTDPQLQRFVRKRVPLPTSVEEGLKQVAKSLSVPLKSVLLASYVRVISILCGQTKVITGVMSNGRPEARGGEQIIGLFLNVVPLAFELPSGTWEDLIKDVFAAETETLPFRRYPFAQIQLDQGGVLFDTVFNYLHFRAHQRVDGDGLEILERHANDQTYFLMTVQFMVDWRTSKLELTLDFNATGICDDQIESIAGQFSRVLAQIAGSPRQNYRSQPQVSDVEWQKMLVEWNSKDADLPAGSCFHRLFEEQVKATPAAIAVADNGVSLTYEELNMQANQLARSLEMRGVGPESLVALLVPRSVSYLVAMLGIFKAGAAFLPLSSEWPTRRIQEVLRRSGSRLVLYTDEFYPSLEAALHRADRPALAETLNLSQVEREGQSASNLPHESSPANLAYVIYTSGSTGGPKGVMIELAGMLNHLFAKIEDLQLSRDCVVAQTANQCFDISVWQFLAALLVGGRVEIFGDDATRDPLVLARLIQTREVNIFETVPALLRAMLETLGTTLPFTKTLASLRRLVITGEALPVDLCQQWLRIYPAIPVVNAYGPTECSDDVTHHTLTGPPPDNPSFALIGHPVRNTRIYVLDGDLNPVALGVTGELFVGGAGVGRGYLDDPAQTSVAFIPDLFASKIEGSRLYRTGDFARFLPDGCIEFVGRMDRQMKLRGFRLEAGEIESALRQHPAVKDAVVKMQNLATGDVLVAYLVLTSGHQADPKILHEFLKQRLPDYAIPSAFVFMKTLPTNHSGKIDLARLPAPPSVCSEPKVRFVAARTLREARLARLWEQTLVVDKIGIYDDFFDLGGHSLVAITLTLKMSEDLGQDVPVRLLLSHPSIFELLNAIDQQASSRSDLTLATSAETRTHVRFSLVSLEQRPLSELVTAGEVAPIDAAALGYVPIAALRRGGWIRDDVFNHWFGGAPKVRCIFSTPIGRIGHLTLPRLSTELYQDKEDLLDGIVEGMELAGSLGARSVSLTGLIPSATDYGRAVIRRINGRDDLPRVTTGHATTSAAVVLAIEKILAESGRELARERVGFLGIGSIGLASLRLMLKILPHPREILLCDLYSERGRLNEVQREIVERLGFTGPVYLHSARAKVPPEFYKSTLIVGATNVEHVLDIQALAGGSLVVDDSAPHCFDQQIALQRLAAQGDILFTEGGILKSSSPISEVRYAPLPAENDVFAAMTKYRVSDYDLMGCIFSSLLPAMFDDLEPTLGLVELDSCIRHYQRLKELGIEGPALCCGDYLLPAQAIQRFRYQFGDREA
jgi:amino acid adenylation domain-containing protein